MSPLGLITADCSTGNMNKNVCLPLNIRNKTHRFRFVHWGNRKKQFHVICVVTPRNKGYRLSADAQCVIAAAVQCYLFVCVCDRVRARNLLETVNHPWGAAAEDLFKTHLHTRMQPLLPWQHVSSFAMVALNNTVGMASFLELLKVSCSISHLAERCSTLSWMTPMCPPLTTSKLSAPSPVRVAGQWQGIKHRYAYSPGYTFFFLGMPCQNRSDQIRTC